MTKLLDIFSHSQQQLNYFSKQADQIIERAKTCYDDLPLDSLATETGKLKEKIANGATEDDVLVDAYALVSAAATKVLGMTPYKVQLIGGIILNQGMIAEMHTGEGKTLTATLPMYLNALSGKGAHLITVNPYLANRDAKELTPLYNALGLTVGVNDEKKTFDQKRAAYQCDITYTTNSELGFDYLRDNIANSKKSQIQRGFNYALMDEADSILIDNAQTPLIISTSSPEYNADYQRTNLFVRSLPSNKVILEKEHHAVRLKPSGVSRAKQFYGDDLFVHQQANVHFLITALQARFLYHNGEDYLIKHSKSGLRSVELVDSNTGRILPGQRYSEGIHQALEAKENVFIKPATRTAASITYQSLFQHYRKVAGMTGTAMTDQEELETIYGLRVLPVPTRKPVKRIDLPDKVFATEEEKYQAVAAEIIKYNDRHQPVLVGTTSVKNSRRLSHLLDNYGIKHSTLNADNPEYEADIVAKAGQRNAVTIATNMAGRGTDIKLADGVKELGGLVVLGTERHDSPRIDNQLRGRSARQGQPGITQFFVSLQDELFDKYKPLALNRYQKKYNHNVKITDIYNSDQIIVTEEDKMLFKVTCDQKNIANNVYIDWNDKNNKWVIASKDVNEFIKLYGGKKIAITFVATKKNDFNSKNSKIINETKQDILGQTHNCKTKVLKQTPSKIYYQFIWNLKGVNKTAINTSAIANKHLVHLFDDAQKELSKQNYENRKSNLTYENIIANERDHLYQQRQEIIDKKVNLYELMQHYTIEIMDNYFKTIIHKKATHQLIQSIQKQFIEPYLGNYHLELGTNYHTAKEIKQHIQNIVLNELTNRYQFLGKDTFDSILSIILLKIMDFYWSKEIIFLNDLEKMISFEGNRQNNSYTEYQQQATSSYDKMLLKIKQRTFQQFYRATIVENKSNSMGDDNDATNK